jgi:hypothetical protein
MSDEIEVLAAEEMTLYGLRRFETIEIIWAWPINFPN